MKKIIISILVVIALVSAVFIYSGNSGEENIDGRITLKIGYLPITDHLTIIAHAKTTYTNLILEPVRFSSWPEIAEAINAGAIDGGFLLAPMALELRSKGTPVKAVLLGHRNGSVLTVSNKILPGHNADCLKGTRIAIPNRFSTHNILIRKYLADNGIDAKEQVKLIEMAPPEMVNALSTGAVDAFIVAEPFGGQAELQGIGRVQVLSKDIWPEHICCVLNIREDVIANNQGAIKELIQSLIKAGQFITDNPQEAAKLGNKYLGQKSDVLEHVLTTPRGRITFDNLDATKSDFEQTQDYLRKFEITSNSVDIDEYLYKND